MARRLSAEQLVQRSFDLGLLDNRQVQQIWSDLGTHAVELEDLVQVLLRREFLTNYQIDRLQSGEKNGFFFGDYKVLYHVGAGSFARVFRAMHRETGEVFALKVLRQRFSETPEQYKLFVREGMIGRSLRHENIVPIYEVFSKKKTHFFVMEFVEGRDLRKFIKVRGRIEPAEAVRLMIEIASGLKHAFDRSTTHRDLKTSNVLVSSSGQAKLVDFGLAGLDDGSSDVLDADATAGRTIDYAALERTSNAKRDDPRSDIYFLGCIFYHMLTGQPALSETRDRAVRLSKTRLTSVKPIQEVAPDLPMSVCLIANKAMMLDVERRYQTPGAMLTDLRMAARRLKDGDDVSAADAAKGVKPEKSKDAPLASVLIVESQPELQDLFRKAFKKAGFRVLVMSDPDRAFDRLAKDPRAAHCILVNSQSFGASALKMFNRLGEETATSAIPAALLLDEPQKKWRRHAWTSERRLVVDMPISMKKLRTLTAKLAQLRLNELS
jgi:eukaryotic-like serine/threonine-protein kinase